MRSMPGALWGFNILISCLGSRRVKACRLSDGWVCVVISLSTSGSWMLCGVKTSDRCIVNSSTFSLSLLAQGPGGMEFLRFGGSDVCGLFLDLIALHMELSSLLREET